MEAKGKGGMFYKVLLGILLILLLAFVYIRFGLLRPWLTRYEASQPKYASQEVFDDLFSPANWGKVYDLAGLEDDVYQDREEFIRSMEERLEDQELSLVETSAGLSGDRRYLVKAGGDNVAAFALTRLGEGDGARWELCNVDLLMEFPYDTVWIKTMAGQLVVVDGVELGEDCQVQATETLAERYLPEGVHGRRTLVWQAQARTPQIQVLDGDSARIVPLNYDEESGCYVVEESVEEPTEEERAMLVGAAKTYARYMIRESNSAQLQNYFDSSSAIYKTIRSSEIWIKQTSGHTFSNETVTGFQRYGEEMFSARVTMHMDVKRANGTAKPYEIDNTFFFHKKASGWRAFEMTNVDVQEEIVRTRLVFMDGETELGRLFVSSEEHSFTPPTVPSRPGQRFTGWAVREQEGNSVTMAVRFQPGADGTVSLPAGYKLEPMMLYAVFESA